MARRASRVDGNQSALVSDLRAMGCSVQHLHTVGMGCPDLVVGWRGRNWLFEVKDGTLPPSARRLTEPEKRWHEAWRGQVSTVETAEQAMSIMRADMAGDVQTVPFRGTINV